MPLYFYFFITLIIELPLVILYFRKQRKQALIVGFLLNLLTWPLLHIFLFETTLNIPLLEAGVAIVEGVGYFLLMKCNWWKGLVLSFFVNGLSYGIGILINNYISSIKNIQPLLLLLRQLPAKKYLKLFQIKKYARAAK